MHCNTVVSPIQATLFRDLSEYRRFVGAPAVRLASGGHPIRRVENVKAAAKNSRTSRFLLTRRRFDSRLTFQPRQPTGRMRITLPWHRQPRSLQSTEGCSVNHRSHRIEFGRAICRYLAKSCVAHTIAR